jgi:hypothetical protein
MRRISKDMAEGLYTGLSIGVGIAGFILVSLLTRALMPAWGPLSDFGAVMWCAGWASIWVIYITLYTFTVVYIWPTVRRFLLSEGERY